MAKAKARFDKLHHVWHSSQLSLDLKLSLYHHAVACTLTHGYEAWKLTPGIMAILTGSTVGLPDMSLS